MEGKGTEIGLVGLGLMGTAMSARLLEADYRVLGFDVSQQRRREHEERGGTVAESPGKIASRCRLVVLSLPNAEIVREACFGTDGVLSGAGAGTVVVDTTTTRPDDAIAVGDEFARHGVTFLDLGVSGNSARVERGEALGVIGGPLADVGGLSDAIGTFCNRLMHAGDVGDGMRAKLVINHVLTLNRFALAEGLVHAEKLGMESQTALDVLRASAAFSSAMDMWGQRMVDEEYEPPASRIRGGNKDLQLILALAREAGAPSFLLGQVDHVVRAMLANDMGDLDNAALAGMLRRFGGVGSPEAQRTGEV